MKRIVEMVGIGDTGTLSATLQVAPLHKDDIGLIILGSQKGTAGEIQSNDYLQIRNSAGAAMACATSAGEIYCTTIYAAGAVSPGTTIGVTVVNAQTVCAALLSGDGATIIGTIKATNLTATSITATSIQATSLTGTNLWVTTTGYIPGVAATTVTATTVSATTSLWTLELSAMKTEVDTGNEVHKAAAVAGTNFKSTRAVGICATVDGTAMISACYIPVAANTTVFIEAMVTAMCTAGMAAGSGCGFSMNRVAYNTGASITCADVHAGTNCTTASYIDSATMSAYQVGLSAGTAMVALTVRGSASHDVEWGYDLTYRTLAV